MSYSERLKGSLAGYKRKVLEVDEDGIWSENGRPYPHILPNRLKFLNLLPPYREEIIQFLDANPQVGLHRDFHHLNSSQAMAFNLLYPLAAEPAGRNALSEVLRLVARLTSTGWTFEKIFDPTEGTNFDFYAELDGGPWLLAELKLSESGFSSTDTDDYHLGKLRDIYLKRLAGRVDPILLEPTNFFRSYQLCRNLAGLRNSNDRLVFLYPKGNTDVDDQAHAFIELVTEPFRGCVGAVHLESLVTQLLGLGGTLGGRLVGQLEAFAEKYLSDLSLSGSY